MHEMSITENMLSVVLEYAEKASAKRVSAINLCVGEMSGLIDDSIQFYFDFLSQGTLAEKARLSFTRVPVRFRCRQCGAEFEPAEREWACPACGATGGEIVAGREMRVESIEVE
mgnify:CR=1 FL=1